MQWTVFGEREIYASPFVRLALVDVQQPDGRRWEYHVVRLRSLAAVVMVDDAERVLLMWRHRFITEGWGWELPVGKLLNIYGEMADAPVLLAMSNAMNAAIGQHGMFDARTREAIALAVGKTFERARQAGWSDAELAELFAYVAVNLFTNYFNHHAQTELDIPAAPGIPA